MKIPIYPVSEDVWWQTHTPLALAMLLAYAKVYKNGSVFDQYQLMPPLDMSAATIERISKAFGPGIWLFSNYVWTSERSLSISKLIKEIDPRNITVHGGPSTPKYPAACEKFLKINPHVDIAVRGEGEVTTAELLEGIAGQWNNGMRSLEKLENVAGVTLNLGDQFIRTADRPRVDDLDTLPSPYLTGIFENFNNTYLAAILETNRGCPYTCTFCDWGSMTAQKIKLFDLDRVFGEIEWVGKKEIPVIFFGDANFGILERDIEIAAHIAAVKEKYGFPKELVFGYAKNGVRRIAEIVKIFQNAAITCNAVISIQTRDEETLNIVKRSNIRNDRYDQLTQAFREENLPVAADLMIGLPGATLEKFKKDLQFFIDEDIPAKAYPTRVLPNSPMADPDYMQKYDIKVDAVGNILSTFSYTNEDLVRMEKLCVLYHWCELYGFLRYISRYLQWDHGILVSDLLEALANHLEGNPAPVLSEILNPPRWSFTHLPSVPARWDEFYQEITRFIALRFQIEIDPAFQTALTVNRAIMPDLQRDFPETISLDYDFVQYFHDHHFSSSSHAPLADYPPGMITISDPDNLVRRILDDYRQYDAHKIFWELDSGLNRVKTQANLLKFRVVRDQL
jgi:radical SAM superfamily enzyme YgiQ (UPF0313 family)